MSSTMIAIIIVILFFIVGFTTAFFTKFRKPYEEIISPKDIQKMNNKDQRIVKEFFSKNSEKAMTWRDFYIVYDKQDQIRQKKEIIEKQKNSIRL